MPRWFAAISSLVVLAFSASDASACRVYRPPAEHLAARLALPYEAITAATVSHVESVGDDDAPWWRATFRADRVITGEPTSRSLTSEQFGGRGLCWRVPTPAVGERWIVFLTHADDEAGFAYPEALLPNELFVTPPTRPRQ